MSADDVTKSGYGTDSQSIECINSKSNQIVLTIGVVSTTRSCGYRQSQLHANRN